MGESKFKTKFEQAYYDEFLSDINKQCEAWHTVLNGLTCKAECYDKAFELYLHSMGYSIKTVNLPDTEETLFAYGIVGDHNNIKSVFSAEDRYLIMHEIADFAEFKIKKLIEGSKADG